ncbi:hypothetical protein [Stetteria hydrogenophila]
MAEEKKEATEAAPGTVAIEVDFSHIPVKPTTAKEVRELEVALIIASLFRPDVLKQIMDPSEFTTWVDSLAVAAGALAREKAGYPIRKIAEELGRTEATIRRHLAGETKAGSIVKETYSMLAKGKIKLAVPVHEGSIAKELEECRSKIEALNQEVEKLKAERDELKAKINELEEAKKKLEEKIAAVKSRLEELIAQL